METPKIEMSNSTGIGEEVWEGLGDKDKGRNKNKGKKAGEDLVSYNVLSIVII